MDQALELRKIVLVGLMPDLPDTMLRDERGVPLVLPASYPVKMRVAFWIPAPRPYKRCAGGTVVPDAYPHELEALRAGVITEEVHEFSFPEQPDHAETRRRLFPVWEGLTKASLGFLPNAVPQDTTTKPTIQLHVTAQERPEPCRP